jgi:hypothetical protein
VTLIVTDNVSLSTTWYPPSSPSTSPLPSRCEATIAITTPASSTTAVRPNAHHRRDRRDRR